MQWYQWKGFLVLIINLLLLENPIWQSKDYCHLPPLSLNWGSVISVVSCSIFGILNKNMLNWDKGLQRSHFGGCARSSIR